MNIKLENVSRSFGKVKAIGKISTRISTGTRVGLVGPNGSGKTTLMRILMGLINFEGKVLINDQPLQTLPPIDKSHFAYISQIAPSFLSSVKEIAATSLNLRQASLKLFQSILERLSIPYETIKNMPFLRLSGGMKQKFMIALAFAGRPQLVFLDEPTASLDAKARECFYQLCKDLEKDVTFVLTSHRIEEIRHIVNHCIELNKGEIAFEGSTQQYLENKTICLLEVYLKNQKKDAKALKSKGFSLSYSGWWSLLLPQNKKIEMIKELQNSFEIENFVVKDVEVGHENN